MINNNRLFGLDILRSIAILAVVFAHSIWLLYGFFAPNSIGDFIFIFTASSFGYIGVEIFFVLSGFLIGTIFIKEVILKFSNNYLQLIKLFWIKRWFRTLPNYYLYILIYICEYWLMDWSGIEGFSWKYLLFLHNLVSTGPGFIYVAWSLAVEEWFYLLMPLLFLLFNFNKNGFTITIFILFSVPFIARFFYVIQHFEDETFTPMLGFATIYRLDSIAYGVFFAHLWSKSTIKRNLLKHKNKLFFLSFTSFIGFLVYMALFISKPIQHPILVLISYPLLSIIVTLSLPFMLSLPSNNSNYIRRVITFVSIISYSLYLSHPLFIKFFDSLKHQYNPNLIICFVFWISTIALSMVFSYFTYFFCERKFLQLREKVILKNL